MLCVGEQVQSKVITVLGACVSLSGQFTAPVDTATVTAETEGFPCSSWGKKMWHACQVKGPNLVDSWSHFTIN